jgi:hypothetical protein
LNFSLKKDKSNNQKKILQPLQISAKYPASFAPKATEYAANSTVLSNFHNITVLIVLKKK